MRIILVSLVVLFGSVGCCATYKNALCNLSKGSANVATHYEGYVEAEPDAATKEARKAEVTQFKAAIQAASEQCKQGGG